MNIPTHRPAIAKAIKMFGSQKAFAARIGASQTAVSYWLNGGKEIPPKRAVQIEAVTGGEVSRKELRPDLWG